MTVKDVGLVFWMAEVIERGDDPTVQGDSVEVMAWLDPAGDGLSIPRSDRLLAWVRGRTFDVDDFLRDVLDGVGLKGAEINGRTDPIVGRSWFRGIAKDERGRA